MRASRWLHSSPLLNTGYNLAEKKKMMFARFILWDMSGGRQERKQKCGNLGSAEDEVLCLGVRPRIWGRFFARHHAGHFKLAFRVGAGVVLGGAGTLASPWAERCLVCIRCGVRVCRATQASPTRTETPSPTNSRKTYPRAQSSNIHIHSV